MGLQRRRVGLRPDRRSADPGADPRALGLAVLLPKNSPAWMDNNVADVVLADRLGAESRPVIQRRSSASNSSSAAASSAPGCHAAQGRCPSNMVNWPGETAMSDFDKIQNRDLAVWPQDHRLWWRAEHPTQRPDVRQRQGHSYGVRYGLSGVLGQLNKGRGAEQMPSISPKAPGTRPSTARLSTGAISAACTARRPSILVQKAFLLLEQNEKTLGWRGRRGR